MSNLLIFVLHGLLPSKITFYNYANEPDGLWGNYQGPSLLYLHRLLHCLSLFPLPDVISQQCEEILLHSVTACEDTAWRGFGNAPIVLLTH
ncbi:hypothetical protein GDO81_019150 [Engystomops pustulosus]|uniref:Secreted protein n=1 Tax=Engystomops pustulosus TaxID=76066 RepID=A0AAV6YBU4_ENGPU|nr:hypothetical protein GDO81_019150 [Engystomops pustulosus]